MAELQTHFEPRKVVEAYQRVQIIVVMEKLETVVEGGAESVVREEVVVNSVDRPIPVPYEQ